MIADVDIWRAANFIIRQHGADAEIEAARKDDLMLERGDRDGQLLWLRISGPMSLFCKIARCQEAV